MYLWQHKLRGAFLSQSVQAAIAKYHGLGALLTTTLFLTVLEDGKSKIEVSADSGLLRAQFLVHKWHLLCPYRVEGSRELSGVYFIRALSPSLGFHPHDIITSQRPHLFFFFLKYYTLKKINLEYSREGLMLNLNLQYQWPPDEKSRLTGKSLMVGKIESKRRRGQQRTR